MENKKCDHEIVSGIKCEVKNCTYHDESHNCHAGSIKVGPTEAETTTDTICETFEAK